MRLIATRVIAVFLLLVCSMFAQQEPLKLGVNVLDVNDWSGSPYFSDLLHHARARSPHAQKPLWTVEGQAEHPLLGARPQLTDVEVGGLVSGAFGAQNTQIRRITGASLKGRRPAQIRTSACRGEKLCRSIPKREMS